MEKQNLKSFFSKLPLPCISPFSLLSCSLSSLMEEVKAHVFQWTGNICFPRGGFVPLYPISDKHCKFSVSLKIQEEISRVPIRKNQNPHLRVQRVCRCTQDLRRLGVMVTHALAFALRGAFLPFTFPGALAFCPSPTQCCRGLAMHWCFGIPARSASSVLKSRMVFELAVWSMWCISSLVYHPRWAEDLILVPMVSIWSWTNWKPVCQSCFAQITQSLMLLK